MRVKDCKLFTLIQDGASLTVCVESGGLGVRWRPTSLGFYAGPAPTTELSPRSGWLVCLGKLSLAWVRRR